jgi:Flp pilus assembly CpaF family ATPase
MALNRELVLRLQAEVGDRRTAERQARRAQRLPDLIGEAERQHTRPIIRAVVEAYSHRLVETTGMGVPDDMQTELVRALDARLFGAGPFQHLLDNDKVEDIHCNGYDRIFVRYSNGEDEQVDPVCDSNEELVQILQDLASYTGLSSRPFDTSNVELDLRLPDGSRLSAVMDVARRPALSIRRARMGKVFMSDLVGNGTLTPEVAHFLACAVRARKNVMIAGATNAGKTTLLRALANEIPPHERLITVERALELGLDTFADLHPNVVAFEERLPNSEGQGAISMAELVRRSLRMNPSRVTVGEVLGDEIVTMLNAMSQGNDGSLSTIHANSSSEVFNRISTYALQASERLPIEASQMLVAGAVNFVVFIQRRNNYQSGGRLQRMVTSIREVNGVDGRVLSSEVFAEAPDGSIVPHAPLSCLDDLIAHGYRPTGTWG